MKIVFPLFVRRGSSHPEFPPVIFFDSKSSLGIYTGSGNRRRMFTPSRLSAYPIEEVLSSESALYNMYVVFFILSAAGLKTALDSQKCFLSGLIIGFCNARLKCHRESVSGRIVPRRSCRFTWATQVVISAAP